jgi:hypothetical protein
MGLLHYNPVLMGYKAIPDDMKVGDTLSGDMSPLQAAHLLLELLGHKVADPTMQVAPADWDQDRSDKLARSLAALDSPNTVTKVSTHFMDDTKPSEMRRAIAKRANSISPVEAFSLVEKGFETLGIVLHLSK